MSGPTTACSSRRGREDDDLQIMVAHTEVISPRNMGMGCQALPEKEGVVVECPECGGTGVFGPTSDPADDFECVLCGGEGELPWPRADGDRPGRSATWKD